MRHDTGYDIISNSNNNNNNNSNNNIINNNNNNKTMYSGISIFSEYPLHNLTGIIGLQINFIASAIQIKTPGLLTLLLYTLYSVHAQSKTFFFLSG